MNNSVESAVNHFITSKNSALFADIKRGLEKESLRIEPSGALSQKVHPEALGAALTHRYITTDYSEALLEFITAATADKNRPLTDLQRIHQFVYQHIGDELLWATSMPCVMEKESDIPVAQYGSSNAGRMKTVYREGLGHRYGRVMQTIAGIHYNFSLPESFWQSYQVYLGNADPVQDFISSQYFHLIRNFHRYGWLLSYFYGASPALCESFLKAGAIKHAMLKPLDKGTYYAPYGTSLRMSDIGYSNNAQSQLNIGYDSLKGYVKALNKAITTPEPLYQKIGIKVDGEYRQLNHNLLQIENEYYSAIRPKQTTSSGERPTLALKRRGVEYIEIRSLDLNPFEPIGLNEETCAFLDVFLLFCLFHKSPSMTIREQAEVNENHRRIVEMGRKRPLSLRKDNRDIAVETFALGIVEQLGHVCELLSDVYDDAVYQRMHRAIVDKIKHPELTLSGQVLQAIQDKNHPFYGDGSFFGFAKKASEHHKARLQASVLPPDLNQAFEQEAKRSIQAQAAIESSDNISFEQFVSQYFE